MVLLDDLPTSPHRRTLVIGGVLAVTIGLPLAALAAPRKVSQSSASYQPRPKGQQRCNACNQWQPPNGCKTVDGTIDPLGWCDLFVSKF